MSALVTKEAIDFTAKAILQDGSISDNFNLKEYVENKLSLIHI